MNSSTIRTTIQPFLDSWRDRPDYAGALLTGSYATDTADEGSDIDLRILYKSDTTFREMGERTLEEKCISFVGMSAEKYREAFQKSLLTTSKFEIRRFTVGIILEDPFGELQQLKEHAQNMLQNPIATFLPAERLHELLMLSNQYKVFLEIPEWDIFQPMAYYDLLKNMLLFYAKFTQADIPIFIKKWSRFFEQADYRIPNQLTEFPDQRFVDLYLQATADIDIKMIDKLYQYLIGKAGGFPLTDFMIRFDDDQGTANLLGIS